MRWIYFSLAVFAAGCAVLVGFFGEPVDRMQQLRICITGAIVNAAIFAVMTWAKNKGEARNRNDA